jgi:exodeoxyribonuclease VII small subunit
MAKEITFEKALTDLETIVELLERGELSLEESIAKFEEGVGLAGKCAEMLKGAEIKVQTLVKRAEGSFDVREMDVSPEEDVGNDEED